MAQRQQHRWRVTTIIRLTKIVTRGLDNPSILDVGSGRGETMRALTDAMNANVTGVDLDPHCVEVANSIGTGVLSTVEEFSKSGQKFDVVISSHSLEHMRDPLGALEAMKQLSSGPLIVLVPNPLVLTNIVKLSTTRNPPCANLGHRQLCDASHLRTLIEHHLGMRITSWSTDWVPVIPGLKLRTWFIRAGLGSAMKLLESDLLALAFPFLGASLAILAEPQPKLDGNPDNPA